MHEVKEQAKLVGCNSGLASSYLLGGNSEPMVLKMLCVLIVGAGMGIYKCTIALWFVFSIISTPPSPTLCYTLVKNKVKTHRCK